MKQPDVPPIPLRTHPPPFTPPQVVQDTGEQGTAGRMGALLGQFNVATFRTSEDDAAFWNRLIPEHERPKEADPGLVRALIN